MRPLRAWAQSMMSTSAGRPTCWRGGNAASMPCSCSTVSSRSMSLRSGASKSRLVRAERLGRADHKADATSPAPVWLSYIRPKLRSCGMAAMLLTSPEVAGLLFLVPSNFRDREVSCVSCCRCVPSSVCALNPLCCLMSPPFLRSRPRDCSLVIAQGSCPGLAQVELENPHPVCAGEASAAGLIRLSPAASAIPGAAQPHGCWHLKHACHPTRCQL